MIYINNKLLKRNYFPAGEIKIPKDVIPKDNFYDITLRYTDDLDLLHLYLVRNCISKINPKASCQLTISYIPHARMDRENDTYFETISIIKKFIKELDFKLIYIPKENKIFEIKSKYYYEKDLETNLLKEKTCKDLGYNFEFKIY